MLRLKVISGHLSPGAPHTGPDLRAARCGAAAGGPGEDVVVVHGRRTAIGRAKKGGFKVALDHRYKQWMMMNIFAVL
uniref:Uncharacterized protein n=1 Tax=Oryzias sinensis TaxID=183150 RepID=A0A8C8DN35_9TELE